jgi:hypothetical protein
LANLGRWHPIQLTGGICSRQQAFYDPMRQRQRGLALHDQPHHAARTVVAPPLELDGGSAFGM